MQLKALLSWIPFTNDFAFFSTISFVAPYPLTLTNGLDDRVIEVYKLLFIEKLKVTENELFYIEFSKDMSDQRFTYIKENGEKEYFEFTKGCYDGMLEDLNSCKCFVNDESYIVDFQYADDMLNKCDEEEKSKN